LARTSIGIWAPAKINLGLQVLGLRPDGYHDIRTVFVAVDLYDHLQFTRTVGGGVRLRLIPTADDARLRRFFPLDEGNLIMRAVRLVERQTGIVANLAIEVRKTIPIAAGLGGGSSDAAATLRALTRLYDLDAGPGTLGHWAAAIGSDVPFFLGSSMAEGTGRGEIIRPFTLFADWWAVLVCPPVFLPAREVYGQLRLTSRRPNPSFRQSRDAEGFLAALRQSHNDLEHVVIRRVPDVIKWLEHLKESGADGVFISGSGPTACGVFRRRPSERIVNSVQDRWPRVQVFVVHPVSTADALRER
jgi:4-diphosphocytidyl-2-C-methyl-D-erythritol kinase